MNKTLFLTADHAGFKLKEDLKIALNDLNLPFKIIDLSVDLIEGDDYPVYAKLLAEKIFNQPEALGIAMCGSGQGICMALNRFRGIRAAYVTTPEEATLTRNHNHAQVICLAGFSYKILDVVEIVKAFLIASPSLEIRHLLRIDQLDHLTI
jgi:ribose 5-phosphate isomerase B